MHSIPEHLPKKLTISFWWNYFLGTQKGDYYYDLEEKMIELKERGFNTIRIDAGIGLCYTRDGRRRGMIKFSRAFGQYSSVIRQLNGKGGKCDVLKRLTGLLELAAKYDVYVILSSWFYLHTFWYVSNKIKQDMFGLPVEERFMYMAQEFGRLLDLLKEKGLASRIAFVEIINENDGGAVWGLFRDAQTSDVSEQARRLKFRTLHEEAIAFLRARHPDLLIACDTCSGNAPLDILPRNMQVWNHHAYYLWPIYNNFEEGLYSADFDLKHPHKYDSKRPYIREKIISFEKVRNAHFDKDIEDGWYRRVWLYNNVDKNKLNLLDKWLEKTLQKDYAEYENEAIRHVAAAVETCKKHFPGVPLVMGEAASYCAHTGLRWEEKAEKYWELIEYTTNLVKKHDYWGYMLRTTSGPEDPVWLEFPDRLRYLNKLFLKNAQKQK